MAIPAFLYQVDISLIPDKDFVAASARVDSRGVQLIAISQLDAMYIATNKECHRVGRTIGNTRIHHLLVVGVNHPSRHVATVCHHVGTEQERCLYC